MVNNTSRGRKISGEWIVGQAKHCLVPWFRRSWGLPSPDTELLAPSSRLACFSNNPKAACQGVNLCNSALHNIFSLHSLVNELYSLENIVILITEFIEIYFVTEMSTSETFSG